MDADPDGHGAVGCRGSRARRGAVLPAGVARPRQTWRDQDKAASKPGRKH
jgi:hypothetical protein